MRGLAGKAVLLLDGVRGDERFEASVVAEMAAALGMLGRGDDALSIYRVAVREAADAPGPPIVLLHEVAGPSPSTMDLREWSAERDEASAGDHQRNRSNQVMNQHRVAVAAAVPTMPKPFHEERLDDGSALLVFVFLVRPAGALRHAGFRGNRRARDEALWRHIQLSEPQPWCNQHP